MVGLLGFPRDDGRVGPVAVVASTEVTPRPLRIILSVELAVIAFGIAFVRGRSGEPPLDFPQLYDAARALFSGADPYAVVGPGLAFNHPALLVYPLTAAVAVGPLALLPQSIAGALFVALGAGALAWVLMRDGIGPLLGFLSFPVVLAVRCGQWAPLFTAATCVLPLGVFLAAKPTIGATIFAARPSWWPVLGGLVLAGVAFALQPAWIPHWMEAVRANAAVWAPASPYRIPVTLPGGVLVLVVLARWRRPEARLVAVLACVPQTLWVYDCVPLLLIPTTWKQASVLVVSGYLAHLWATTQGFPPQSAPLLEAMGKASLVAYYLPCVVMVLRRPNEGALPAWIERRTLHWPAWLRGAAVNG